MMSLYSLKIFVVHLFPIKQILSQFICIYSLNISTSVYSFLFPSISLSFSNCFLYLRNSYKSLLIHPFTFVPGLTNFFASIDWYQITSYSFNSTAISLWVAYFHLFLFTFSFFFPAPVSFVLTFIFNDFHPKSSNLHVLSDIKFSFFNVHWFFHCFLLEVKFTLFVELIQ